MALIKVKDVKEAIALMMSILEKLDEVYHALKDTSKDKEVWNLLSTHNASPLDVKCNLHPQRFGCK